MSFVRWFVTLVGIAVIILFGLKTAQAGLSDNGLTVEAFRGLTWVLVSYLATDLFLKISK